MLIIYIPGHVHRRSGLSVVVVPQEAMEGWEDVAWTEDIFPMPSDAGEVMDLENLVDTLSQMPDETPWCSMVSRTNSAVVPTAKDAREVH